MGQNKKGGERNWLRQWTEVVKELKVGSRAGMYRAYDRFCEETGEWRRPSEIPEAEIEAVVQKMSAWLTAQAAMPDAGKRKADFSVPIEERRRMKAEQKEAEKQRRQHERVKWALAVVRRFKEGE